MNRIAIRNRFGTGVARVLALGLWFSLVAAPGWAQPRPRAADPNTTSTSTRAAPENAPAPAARVATETSTSDFIGDELAPPPPNNEIRLNFRGVPLDTVLDYLGRAAGFVIVKTLDVEGRITVSSHHPLSPDEAVALLNTALVEHGYAAVRSGRTLTVVRRDEAHTRDVPVVRGNDPGVMERGDEIVTQIIPVRYATVKELVDNLRVLLPQNAILTSNERSNAVILTDTRTGVRRMAEIIRALDQSISEITTLRVYHLEYSDAKEMAALIKEVFQPPQTASGGGQQRQLPPFFGGRGRSEQPEDDGSRSVAIQAASRVNAAADERTNSVVVAAPEDMIPTIERLIAQVDRTTEVLTEVRVFPLQFAVASEMADIILGIFNQQQQGTTARAQPTATRQQATGGRAAFIAAMRATRGGGAAATQAATAQSDRQRTTTTILAVADARTNALVVSAIGDTMSQIEEIVTQLDQNPAKTKRVYVYQIENADPEKVAALLREMFGTTAGRAAGTRAAGTTTRAAGTTAATGRAGTTTGRAGTTGTGTTGRSR